MPKVKQVKHPKHPQITINEKLPFPPEMSADDLLEKSRNSNNNSSKPGKIPNCFLIYRIYWGEHLKKLRIRLELGEISCLASRKWKNESQEVKEHYKRLSAEAKKKYHENNRSRVFIFHNQCGSNINDKKRSEPLGSQESQQISVINDPISEMDYITIPHEINQFSTQPQITQIIQPQFNTNLISDSYTLFDTTSPIIENGLIDFVYQTFNLLINTTSPENYSKLFNVTAPEELGRVKRFHDHFGSIINEKSSYNHFSAINEKMKELEFAASNLLIDVKTNNFVNNSQDNFEFDPTRRDYIFNDDNISNNINNINNIGDYSQPAAYQQPLQNLMTPLNSPSPIGPYPEYPSDNSFSNSQFNNNNLFYLMEQQNKVFEEKCKFWEKKAKELMQIINVIRGLIFGNKI